jgi:hypothetical protein
MSETLAEGGLRREGKCHRWSNIGSFERFRKGPGRSLLRGDAFQFRRCVDR